MRMPTSTWAVTPPPSHHASRPSVGREGLAGVAMHSASSALGARAAGDATVSLSASTAAVSAVCTDGGDGDVSAWGARGAGFGRDEQHASKVFLRGRFVRDLRAGAGAGPDIYANTVLSDLRARIAYV